MLKIFKYKNIIALSIDLAAAAVAFYCGLWIRFDTYLDIANYKYHFVLFVILTSAVNYIFKIHSGIWRYFNFYYLIEIIKAASTSLVTFVVVLFFIQELSFIPRSVLIMDWFLLIAFIVLPRALYRVYFDKNFISILEFNKIKKSPILIIGLGESTEVFIAELNKMKYGSYKAIGIIDDKSNFNRRVYNVPVLGELDELEKIILKLEKEGKKPNRIIISREFNITGQLQELTNIAERLSIPLSRIPKITDLQHGLLPMLALPSIPLEDLLGRSQRTLDIANIKKLIANKKILITGAGGSIGSELVRQVCGLEPADICLVDNSEFLLYEIEQWCKFKFSGQKKLVRLCDIRNEKAIKRVFNEFKPDVVFHAAALKHVPLMEDHKCDAVKTNVLGTVNVLDAALDNQVEHFLMISTDKAVDPSSFMGATKRMAELYCQAMGNRGSVISIVRFGNVLGSNGSVVPLFEKQISEGGPVTVTDPEATRFFMTIREAVGLVLQAASQAHSGATEVFVLDMGEPIKIIDIAEHMIILAGLKPNVDIKIEIIGLRPGEKLHEILVTEHESLEKTIRSDIFIAKPKTIELERLQKAIGGLQNACLEFDDHTCNTIVSDIVK